MYYANYDLISIGAYKKGTNLQLDEAISKIDQVNDFLKQEINENFTFEETLSIMEKI